MKVLKWFLLILGIIVNGLFINVHAQNMPDTIWVPFKEQFETTNLNKSHSLVPNHSDEDPNNLWNKTIKRVEGIPYHWKKIGFGPITHDLLQSTYQEYIHGNISQESFNELRLQWKFKVDTNYLSNRPLISETFVAWGFENDSVLKFRIDKNNNLNVSDDDEYVIPITESMKFFFTDPIEVAFEDYINGKVINKISKMTFFIMKMLG